MSARSSKKAGPAGPAPDPDIYVSLLFVAVGSLLAGCGFLIGELYKYNWTLG